MGVVEGVVFGEVIVCVLGIGYCVLEVYGCECFLCFW